MAQGGASLAEPGCPHQAGYALRWQAAAQLKGLNLDFAGAEFSGGTVDFSDAEFPGGTVGFAGAGFSGGTVDFSRVASWMQPPGFGPGFDLSHPPAGVLLPTATSPSPDSPMP